MVFDDKFLAVEGKSSFDGVFTAVTEHYGKLPAADGFRFLGDASKWHKGLMPNTNLVHEHKLKRGSPRLDHKSFSPVRTTDFIFLLCN